MVYNSVLVETNILILSDTHGAIPEWVVDGSLSIKPHLVIHCGDLTSTGKIEEHQRALQLLTALPGDVKVVIPGNHDLTLDEEYCKSHEWLYGWREPVQEGHLREALEVYTSDLARAAGIVCLVEGFRTLNLSNGASITIYANAYTPEFCDWAFAYPRQQNRTIDIIHPAFPHLDDPEKQDNPHPTIFITHGPPRGVLDKTIHGEPVGCDELLKSVTSVRPLLHCFGHIHEGHGAESWHWRDDSVSSESQAEAAKSKPFFSENEELVYIPLDMTDKIHGQDTVFVNASIMTVQYQPIQRPFLVTLNLPGMI